MKWRELLMMMIKLPYLLHLGFKNRGACYCYYVLHDEEDELGK